MRRAVAQGLSLQYRLPLLLGALLVVVMGALCSAAYLALRGSTEQAAASRLEQVTAQLVGLLRSQAVGMRQQAEAAAAARPVAAFLRARGRAEEQAVRDHFAAQLRADTQTAAIQFLDPAGAPLLALGPAAADPSYRPAPQDLPGGPGAPDSSSMSRMVTRGDTLAFAAIATVWDGARPLGHLVIWRRSVRTGDRASAPIATLIGSDAHLYIGTPGAGWMDGNGATDAPVTPWADTPSADGLLRYHTPADGEVIARAVPVPGTPWRVVLEFPSAAVHAPANRFLMRILGIGAVLLLVGCASAWVLSRHLTGPLVRLAQAADAFGRGERGTRVSTGGEGEIGRLAEAFNQMAERVDGAVALREASEAQWRLLFDQNPRPMWVSDQRTGRFLAVNEAALELYGLERGEFLHRTVAELLSPEPADGNAVEGAVTPFERHQTRHRGTIEVEVTRHHVVFAGEPAELALVQNITARKLQEAQAHQAQKMEAVGRLAGGVAHDFNNLLAVISPYAELLRDEAPPGSRQWQDLDQILAAAERGRLLTRQLLTFSRQRVLQATILSPDDAIRGVEALLRRLLGEDIELTTRLQAGGSPVRADSSQFEQVLINLAVNARDAMPTGGQLVITTATWGVDEQSLSLHGLRGAGRYVVLTVTDTGVGMDAATRSRVFEPFFTTKAPGKGTGIGLATVYGIVTQAGGQITVYSEPGRGTTFRLYFPEATEPSVSPRPAAATHSREELRGTETVLLVEDDVAVRGAAVDILQRSGYTVLVATSAEDAQEIAARHKRPIDLVISDVVMPRMSGPTLLAALRRHRPALKVLLVSGYTGEALAVRGEVAPEMPFLEKPFTVTALLGKVREVLDEVPA